MVVLHEVEELREVGEDERVVWLIGDSLLIPLLHPRVLNNAHNLFDDGVVHQRASDVLGAHASQSHHRDEPLVHG